MNALNAHVENGDLVLDEPAKLREGAKYYVVDAEELEDLIDAAEADRVMEDVRAGRDELIPLEKALAELGL